MESTFLSVIAMVDHHILSGFTYQQVIGSFIRILTKDLGCFATTLMVFESKENLHSILSTVILQRIEVLPLDAVMRFVESM